MRHAFANIAFTPAVRDVQARDGSRAQYARAFESGDGVRNAELGPDEAAFIQAQRSFYMATVSETGWPYVQHRGGEPGFLRVVDPTTLSFTDLPGNRQFISVGNLANDDRVALILMDYAHRHRLKLLGRLAVEESSATGRTQREMRIHVEAFDWNCPKYIPVRFEAEDVQRAIDERDHRIRELEAQVTRLLQKEK
ncbi:pyridoxamine 5'-phosphate oxidase family protein [Pseudoxanthomonas sp. PXM02]|uniref:pyridoxamine 5'-phosphate oxidase family protein n=1 Tax=Pseudoxanthomonas sp. PXM02 TaxID=2769294 RepID=UPI001780BFF9|nr:pyridoxamine 5'-phosphate oxidase family protein [Pseudoxanthomonas sp. PXM02]MBD9478856.1 pyridoxamine 5'-phosphate oxidase family protein [Pseudoxanthomonas sp. PXM02]